MKFLALILLGLSAPLWAKPLVLLSYYDAFGQAPFNNSEKVALALAHELRSSPDLELKLCRLNTVFDKSFFQLEECMKSLPEAPLMVLGLGETGCEMKVEMVMKNLDRTYGADNEGNARNNTAIIPGAPLYQSLRYPLPQMYCALDRKERSDLVVSNFAGSFVCNNTAFQMSYSYPDIQFGFIHVPSHNCRRLERRTETTVRNLEEMIKAGVKFLQSEVSSGFKTPHPSNSLRLPIEEEALMTLRKEFENKDKCLEEFFKRARPAGEKSSFWPAWGQEKSRFYKTHP